MRFFQHTHSSKQAASLPHELVKISVSKYFDQKTLGVNGFLQFCKSNTLLIIFTVTAILFNYGLLLIHTSIGIDTEVLLATTRGYAGGWLSVGRFGLVFLQKIWTIKEFNPFTAAFFALLFLELSTLSWCYLFSVFNKSNTKNKKLIPFALLYISMPMWIEQFYFLLQAAETSFIVLMCPFIIYLMYKGIFDNEKLKIISGIVLLFFITSVYQGIAPMFLCGVFICFIFIQDNSSFEHGYYINIAIKLFVFVSISIVLYLCVAKIFFLHSDYLDNMNSWGEESVFKNIKRAIKISGAIILKPLIQFFKSEYNVYGSIILFPAALLFLYQIFHNAKIYIPKNRCVLYILAGICIPFCVILLPVIGANRPPLRAMYVLPLAVSFIPYYLITKFKAVSVKLIVFIMLVTALYQMEISVQMQYSDYMRYRNDVHIVYEIDKMIISEQDDINSLSIAVIGSYHPASDFLNNFIHGEVVGHSFFEWDIGNWFAPTARVLSFMKTLGVNYIAANEDQTNDARQFSENMPPYHKNGFVKRYNDIIVVKMSE